MRDALPEPRNYTPSSVLIRRWRWRRVVGRIKKSSTFRLLVRIEAANDRARRWAESSGGKVTWLLPFRRELRLLAGFDIRFDGDLEAVRYYLLTCPPTMVSICVWLIGKCSERTHLYELTTFRHDPLPQVRRHVAKALRRLEAWSYLHDMADAYRDDARIQWYAVTPTTHGLFAERLKNYKRSVEDSHASEVATPSRMPFWAGASSWERTPPKSVAYIRRMLRRIRFWVRAGVGR